MHDHKSEWNTSHINGKHTSKYNWLSPNPLTVQLSRPVTFQQFHFFEQCIPATTLIINDIHSIKIHQILVKNGNSQFIGDGKSHQPTGFKKTLLNWIVEVSLLGSLQPTNSPVG